MLTDTHTHLYAADFKEDIDSVIINAISKGISRFFLPNIDLDSISDMNVLCAKYPKNLFPLMGLHPCYVTTTYKNDLKIIEKELGTGNYYAIGEIGIDLYWDKSLKNEQIDAFRIQIEWAKKLQLPIVIHVRDAFNEVFEVIDQLNDDQLTGIFHCFTGSIEQAQKIIAYNGFKIGIGGVVTFKNSGLDKVVEQIDIKHLVLETDAPYLAPTPYRGKRNESAYLSLIAEKIASIYQISSKQVAEITTQNSREIYGI